MNCGVQYMLCCRALDRFLKFITKTINPLAGGMNLVSDLMTS